MNNDDEGRKPVEWSVASRPMKGQIESGDLQVVEFFSQGVLLGAIDGVGHGNEARQASGIAASTLREHAGDSVVAMVKHCHAALTGTRGAVMTLAALDVGGSTVTWMGVGNVEARLFRGEANGSHPCEHILLRAGLVGLQLPTLQATLMPLARGDVLIFATDGIQPNFEGTVKPTETTTEIADGILNRHFKGTDDALVLAVRYLGPAS